MAASTVALQKPGLWPRLAALACLWASPCDSEFLEWEPKPAGTPVKACYNGWYPPSECVSDFTFAGDPLHGCPQEYSSVSGRGWCALNDHSDGMDYAFCEPCEQCSKSPANCKETKCCSEKGMKCYEKDEWFATCLLSCEPGHHEEKDGGGEWTCKVLGETIAGGIAKDPVTTSTSRQPKTEKLKPTTTTATTTCGGRCCVGDLVYAPWPHHDKDKGQYYRAKVTQSIPGDGDEEDSLEIEWTDGNPADIVPSQQICKRTDWCVSGAAALPADEAHALPEELKWTASCKSIDKKLHCHNIKQGDDCYEHVMWALEHGIYEHPEWYGNLTSESGFEDFQAQLYQMGKGGCPRPCDDDEFVMEFGLQDRFIASGRTRGRLLRAGTLSLLLAGAVVAISWRRQRLQAAREATHMSMLVEPTEAAD